MKRLLCAFLLISAALLGGCAKTVIVPLDPDNSNAYVKAKSVFVVLKTAEVYEIEHFVVRGDSLVGTRVFRRDIGTKQDERRVALALDDIATIQVAKTSRLGAAFAGAGVGLVLATATVTIIAIIALASALSGS